MTHRAAQCLKVLHALERSELLMAEAAQLLGRSVRQDRRLRAAFCACGVAALVHGNRGRPPVNRIADRIRTRILHLAATVYVGLNDHHLHDLLTQREGLTLSRPSVQRILRAAGLRSPRRRRPPRHRRRRERMPQAGLLVQLDGSTHAWLDQRGPRLTLIVAMDDATGEVLAATFRDQEDAHGYFQVLHTVSQTKGIPVAVYSDRHGIFHRRKTTPLTLQEQLAGKAASTQVARALQELGIQWVPAHSPQAKGRIERLFGTCQDRLRAELRLAGILDRQGANAFLRDFLPRFNARFAQQPTNPTSAYRPWPTGLDPQTIFCFKYQRTVSNDHTVTLGAELIQLLPPRRGRSYAKALVEIHERLDGSIAVVYQGTRLPCHRLTPPPTTDRIPARAKALLRPHPTLPPASPNGRTPDPIRSGDSPRGRAGKIAVPHRGQWTPPPDHPWRRLVLGKAKFNPLHRGRTKSLNS